MLSITPKTHSPFMNSISISLNIVLCLNEQTETNAPINRISTLTLKAEVV